MLMRKWVPTLGLLVPLVVVAPTAALPQPKSNPPASVPTATPTPTPPPSSSGKSGVYEQLNLFSEAFERIRQDAVEPVGDRRLIETAISGMLASLDPNCVYLTEDDYKALKVPADGQTGTIGLVVTIDGGQLKVVSPRDGSPAARVGIKPGEP